MGKAADSWMGSMTYSVNGVSLQNKDKGWVLDRASIPVLPLEYASSTYTSAGRDGDFIAAQQARRPSTFRFSVKAGLDTRRELLALMTGVNLEIQSEKFPGFTASGYTISSSVESYYEAKGWAKDLFVVEVPSGCWRGPVVTTPITVPAPAGAKLTVFPELRAPVQDAIVRIKGPIEKPQITDPRGSFVVLNATVPANNYLRFDSRTGRAWITTTDTWVGGDEVSGQIDFGGPRGIFEITPPADPTKTDGSVTLTQASYNTGSGFQIRAASAVLI